MKALLAGLVIGTSQLHNPALPTCPEGSILVFTLDFYHNLVAKCAKEVFDPPTEGKNK